MYLNFENEKSKMIAFNTQSVNYENDISEADAFGILIKDVDYGMINKLCEVVARRVVEDEILEKELGPMDIYSLINANDKDPEINNILLEEAYKLVHAGKKMGTRTDGKHNASSWISHCLIEGELMAELAGVTFLDPHTAMKLGILHDIGRKKTHSFLHTVIGFEYMIDQGVVDEAFCALTHSFLSSFKDGVRKGNRCAIGDPALDGFYINEKGEGVFEKGAITDDVTCFLENYQYNSYDIILNIADLMATSEKVIAPYDRVLNIYSKRIPDSRNSSFFKISLINAFNHFLSVLDNEIDYEPINICDINSVEEIDRLLLDTSNVFMDYYLKNIKNTSLITKTFVK